MTERVPWYRQDKYLVPVLFVLLATLNVTTAIAANDASEAAREAAEAAAKSDIVAECFTPDTRCSRFRAEASEKERQYFINLMRTTALCTLETSGAVNTGQIPYNVPAMDEFYQSCVDQRSGTPPTGSSLNPPPAEKKG